MLCYIIVDLRYSFSVVHPSGGTYSLPLRDVKVDAGIQVDDVIEQED